MGDAGCVLNPFASGHLGEGDMVIVKVVVLGIVGVVVALFAGAATFLMAGQKGGRNVAIAGADMSKVPDGVHTGSYKSSRWSNTVAVTVAGHRIQRIDVVDDVVFKDPKVTTGIIGSVIERQTTKVDVISGATITSKAYLKSIENALDGAK